LKVVLDMLKSKNKYERAEGYTILVMIAGTLMLTLGIGLTIIKTSGISAILAMLGALISFLGTVGLIGVWLTKEVLGE